MTVAAPGQMAGYLYQLERALLALAEAGIGDRVGIETLDDVAIQTANGNSTAQQAKHTLDITANPITNKSKNLWKALQGWTAIVLAGDDRTQFQLVTNATVEGAGLAARLRTTPRDVTTNRAIATELRAAAQDPSSAIEQSVTAVMQLSDDALLSLVSRITVLDRSANPSVATRTKSLMQLPSTVSADDIYNELLGCCSPVRSLHAAT